MDDKSTREIFEAERPLEARIEVLEAALRKIAGAPYGSVPIDNYTSEWATKAATIDIAQAALGDGQK